MVIVTFLWPRSIFLFIIILYIWLFGGPSDTATTATKLLCRKHSLITYTYRDNTVNKTKIKIKLTKWRHTTDRADNGVIWRTHTHTLIGQRLSLDWMTESFVCLSVCLLVCVFEWGHVFVYIIYIFIYYIYIVWDCIHLLPVVNNNDDLWIYLLFNSTTFK